MSVLTILMQRDVSEREDDVVTEGIFRGLRFPGENENREKLVDMSVEG